MDALQQDIKDALPDTLDSSRNVKKVEQSLRTSLAALVDQQCDDDKCLLLLKTGIMYLIKVLRLLTESEPLETDSSILNLILDCLVAASEKGSKCNSFIVSTSANQCLDVVLNKKFAFLSRMEVLSRLNIIFASADTTVKEMFIQKDACDEKLKKLFQLILDIGDYEFQVCIVEFLFRLLPRKIRQKYAKNFVGELETLQAFLEVKDGRFEVDCRKFLNRLNSGQQGGERKVYSFPCHKITFGSIELQKPCDEGYNDFWVDFNMGSKRMVIFCENEQLSSQISVGEDCWDTLSVWQTDVHKFSCQAEEGLKHARIHIKATAACVPRSIAFDKYPILHIFTESKHDLEAALTRLYSRKKVSDVMYPIQFSTHNASQEQFSQERHCVGNMKEKTGRNPAKESARQPDGMDSHHSSTERSPKTKAPSNTMSCSHQDSRLLTLSAPNNCRIVTNSGQAQWTKASVPSDVMATPASTISVGSATPGTTSRKKTTRRACTPVSHTPAKKKVKTPVVALQKPVKLGSANTRKTVPVKSATPSASTTTSKKQASCISQKGKDKDTEESPSNIVIPDSLPFPSQAGKPQQSQDDKKRHAGTIDSSHELSSTVQQQKQNSVANKAKSSKTLRSKSLEYLHSSNEAQKETASRSLRSSQRNRSASQIPTSGSHVSSTGSHGRKVSGNVKNPKPSSEMVGDQNERHDSGSIPSSFEEFKAPKSKKTSSGNAKKNVSNSQMSRNSIHSEAEMSQKSANSGKSSQHRKDKSSKNTGLVINDSKDRQNRCEEENKTASADKCNPESQQTNSVLTGPKDRMNNKKGRVEDHTEPRQHTAPSNPLKEKPKRTFTENKPRRCSVKGSHEAEYQAQNEQLEAGEARDADVNELGVPKQKLKSKAVMQKQEPTSAMMLKVTDHETDDLQEINGFVNEMKNLSPHDKVIDRTPSTSLKDCRDHGQISQRIEKQPVVSMKDIEKDILVPPSQITSVEVQLTDVARKDNIHQYSFSKVCRSERASGKTVDQFKIVRPEVSADDESEDDDPTNFRFDLDTSCDSLHRTAAVDTPLKSQHSTPDRKRVQRQEQCTETDSHDTPKLHKRTRDSKAKGGNQHIRDNQNMHAENRQNDTQKSKLKTHQSKSTEEECQPVQNTEHRKSKSKTVESGHCNLVEDTVGQKNQADTVPSARSLRKRQPKSYTEIDYSSEDCETDDDHNLPLKMKGPSKSAISDRKFVFTKAERRTDNQGKCIQKTFTMSICSAQERTNSKISGDPYDFSDEFGSVNMYRTTAANHNQSKMKKAQKSEKLYQNAKSQGNMISKCGTFCWDEDVDRTTSANHNQSEMKKAQKNEKLYQNAKSQGNIVSKCGTFCWDDDVDENDADTGLLQDEEEERNNSMSFKNRVKRVKSNLLSFDAVRRHPASEISEDCMDQSPSCKLLNNWEQTSKQRDRYNRKAAELPLRSKEQKMIDKRKRKQIAGMASMVKDLSKRTSKGDSEGATTVASNESHIAKSKPHTQLSPTSKTSRPNCGSSCSPKHSLRGITNNWCEFSEGLSDLGSECNSPRPKLKAAEPRYHSNMHNSSHTAVETVPSRLYGAGDVSENHLRASAERKEIQKLQTTSSEESSTAEPVDRRQCKPWKLTAALTSPSPTHNSMLCHLGEAAPVKCSKKSTRKIPCAQQDDTEEEVDEQCEKMQHWTQNGFESELPFVNHPTISALMKPKTFHCSDIESENEDGSSRFHAFRKFLQPRELFPDPTDSLTVGAKSTRKRKSPLASKHSPKKSCRKSTTRSINSVSVEQVCVELNEEETVPVEIDELPEPDVEPCVTQPVSGMASLLKGFGFDLQKQIKEREQQVQELAKGALKLSSKRINHIWTTARTKRGHLVNNFKDHLQCELSDLEHDMTVLANMEKTAEATYLKQLKALQDQREKLQNRMKSMFEDHEDFRLEMEQVESQTLEVQKCLEVQLKQDMEQLKSKLLLDIQQQQLRRVKESLQKHFA